MTKKKKLNSKQRFLICIAAFLLILILLIVVTAAGSGSGTEEKQDNTPTQSGTGDAPSEATVAPTESNKHMIEGVKVIPQTELRAGCETYACTMLLQWLGFDIDEFTFAEVYLNVHEFEYDEWGNRYGPDMYSAQAGNVYNGAGIFAPAMAKCMNEYLKTTDSKLRAKALENVPLEQLCKNYIDNGIPVMVWATTWMMEPVEDFSWIVNYVDENARYKIGDTFTWKRNEHCLVLIGYNDKEYYFADSCEGDVSHFEKALCNQRYKQIGMMAIVVQ